MSQGHISIQIPHADDQWSINQSLWQHSDSQDNQQQMNDMNSKRIQQQLCEIHM